MIVRIMGDGQYRLDDSLAPHLAELDAATEDAFSANDQEAMHAALESLAAAVRLNGERLPDGEPRRIGLDRPSGRSHAR